MRVANAVEDGTRREAREQNEVILACNLTTAKPIKRDMRQYGSK